VTRLGNSLLQIKTPVSTLFPAMKHMVAKWQSAGTGEPRGRRDQTFFQRGRGHDHLEGRTRRILTLDRPIAQRMDRILDQTVPLFCLDAASKDIRIKHRMARHSQDITSANVKDDDRSFFTLESGFGLLLQVLIQS